MARADLLVSLVKAGNEGDNALFRKTVEAIIAEERSKQHHVLANRLSEYINSKKSNFNGLSTNTNNHVQKLFWEISPQRNLEDLVLAESLRNACEELVEEQHRADLLRSHNIEPRHRILLAGAPGNGKTSLAEAIAEALMVPMFTIRYEGVVGSYLGETANRLSKFFEFIRTRKCVVFFDEFDTIGKERGDTHESGEIKRVVSSLLLQIDALPSYVVVITASNHPELLDRAVWRRFELRLYLPKPEKKQIEEWLNKFVKKTGLNLNYSISDLAKTLNGLSFAEIEDFATDILRRYVLTLPDADLKTIIESRIKQLQQKFNLENKHLSNQEDE